MYCYLEFKLSYLKNLKLFSIRVKELSEPIVLWRKGRRVLALFISIFLRNWSLSDARWFCGKKRKIGKGNLYLTENRLSWNVMCCASDNYNYMCHTCAKEFFEFELQLKSYWQNIKFSRYCPKFPIFKFRNFSSIGLFATFETNCFIPINFMAGTCQEYSFSFLPVATR